MEIKCDNCQMIIDEDELDYPYTVCPHCGEEALIILEGGEIID